MYRRVEQGKEHEWMAAARKCVKHVFRVQFGREMQKNARAVPRLSLSRAFFCSTMADERQKYP
jgi:hypothetical protein